MLVMTTNFEQLFVRMKRFLQTMEIIISSITISHLLTMDVAHVAMNVVNAMNMVPTVYMDNKMKIQIILDFDTDLSRERFDEFAMKLQNIAVNEQPLTTRLTKMQTQSVNQIIRPNKG